MGTHLARMWSWPLAVCALVVMLALPGPVSADTCACDPIQPYLVTDRFNETHVVYRHAGSPGIVYATNKPESWVKRRLTTSKDTPQAIAVDSAQKVYIVFERETGDDVNYHLLSNRSGEWVRTKLPIVHDRADRIRVVVDGDRKLHVAWITDEKAWYATNVSGTWVRRRLDLSMGNHAEVALGPNGSVHLLFEQCDDADTGACDNAGIHYQTNASGEWVTQRISTDQEDHSLGLVVDPTGKVHVAFSREYNSQANPDLPLGTYYVTNQSGAWVTRRVAPEGRWGNIERSRDGAIWIVYTRVDDDDRRGIYLATNASGTWVRSTVVREWAMYPSTGMGPSGVLHLAYMRMAIDPGIYYSNNRGDGWSRRELMD